VADGSAVLVSAPHRVAAARASAVGAETS